VGREHLRGAIGFIKTHYVTYLPPEHRLVGSLPRTENTGLLYGHELEPISCIFACPHRTAALECDRTAASVRDLAPAAAISLANTAAAASRFASEGHKDSRAPQNLYPIGGLERELRRPLGRSATAYSGLFALPSSDLDRDGRIIDGLSYLSVALV